MSTAPGPSPLRLVPYQLAVLRRTFRGTIFGSFLSPLLYLAALGYGLGSLVNSAAGGIDGVPYVQFIAPGLLVATAMQSAVFDSSYPVLGSIKWQRQFHAMLASPLRVTDVVLGHLGAVVGRGLLSGAVFLAVAAVIGAIPSWTGVLALLAVVLTSGAYAAPMFAVSASVETDISFTLVFRLVVIPMFLFSGAFFPVDQLPVWLQPVAYLVPLWHATTFARDATLGTLQWSDVGHLAYLALWCVVGTWFAVRRLRLRMVV